MEEYRVCTRGIWDTTVPGITFDENGVSNYAKMFDKLCEAYPRGEKGKQYWENIVDKMKETGKGKRYDCIIGVSGGTDSSYLLHIAKKEYGLRPLAVNLDNGWSSDIAVQNIKKVTQALDIDLETYVIDYEEVKAVLRAYVKAGLPWIDGPTDIAIKSVLFKVCEREGSKYVLTGSDFRSEGKQPSEWTYTDAKQILFVVKRFENMSLKSFPCLRLPGLIKSTIIKGIKVYRPFNSIDYKKNVAQKLLKNEYNWTYYGGHHHENIFTKFAISYWLPRKFGIDKRIITLSAQVLSNEITRNEALEQISSTPYASEAMESDKTYVIKKLDMTINEFERFWYTENKYYWDYPSYMPILEKYLNISNWILKHIYSASPTTIIERQVRGK